MPPTLEKYTHYGLRIYSFGNVRSYAVGTEKQVDAAVREYVRDELWAFRPEFLQAYTPEGIDSEIIGIIVEKKGRRADFDGNAGDESVRLRCQKMRARAKRRDSGSAAQPDQIQQVGVSTQAGRFGQVT